jgi:hypothetical protein
MKTNIVSGLVKQFIALGTIVGGLSGINSARAETTISTFENFNLDGLFSSWTSATVVSLATNYSITASGYGSGFKAISPNIDATGETTIESTVTLSGTGSPNGPISGPIVSLVDADGTFYNYAWYGQSRGTYVLSAKLNSPTFVSAPGSVSGLDLSKLAFFHLQDDPGTYTGQYTITFSLLRLTGAPALAISAQSYDPKTQQFTLTWNSKPSKSYSILYAPDLATPFSPLVTDIASGGNSTTNTIPVASGQTAFLRVQEQ